MILWESTQGCTFWQKMDCESEAKAKFFLGSKCEAKAKRTLFDFLRSEAKRIRNFAFAFAIKRKKAKFSRFFFLNIFFLTLAGKIYFSPLRVKWPQKWSRWQSALLSESGLWDPKISEGREYTLLSNEHVKMSANVQIFPKMSIKKNFQILSFASIVLWRNEFGDIKISQIRLFFSQGYPEIRFQKI